MLSRPAGTVRPRREAHPILALLPLLGWTLLLGFFFAHVEIEIEGAGGWAANLPTWRIEHHWLLDLFWGGRPMTGYHAWVFPFVALFFHFPQVFAGRWTWRVEAKIIACIMLFWVTEDFLWFVLNPAFGIARFAPATVPWHKHWLFGAPTDYWVALSLVVFLLLVAVRRRRGAHEAAAPGPL
jgi:hypothetical protein